MKNLEMSIQNITNGPKFHWFAYYDKLQFDPSSRYVLGMEVDFEHRSPKPDNVIKVGMIDLHDNCKWIELGESCAWCWQQGCMLQWIPGSNSKVIWNDREGDRFVCHILDVFKKEKQTLPHPFYTISLDGHTTVCTDFRRVNHTRPGYGYTGIPDPNSDVLAPEDSGIFKLDLETGKHEMIISIADIVKIPNPNEDFSEAKHWFNHLLFNTDGSRFIFLHRWRKGQQGFNTRMITADPDGKNIHIVDDYGQMSHFIWRDSNHILGWAWHPSYKDAFYLYGDLTQNVEVVGKEIMTQNGHCSYLPDKEWIINDTYPDRERKQELYLYNVNTGKKISLGSYYTSPEYQGEWRCDLHPRFNSDGNFLTIDSPHEGNGRQIYLIDIGEIINR
jgi:hypothetical protein